LRPTWASLGVKLEAVAPVMSLQLLPLLDDCQRQPSVPRPSASATVELALSGEPWRTAPLTLTAPVGALLPLLAPSVTVRSAKTARSTAVRVSLPSGPLIVVLPPLLLIV
jgi:hypothetical protein